MFIKCAANNRISKKNCNDFWFVLLCIYTIAVLNKTVTLTKMAETSNLPGSDNLNVKNGNFICGVVEGMSEKCKTISHLS